MWSNFCEFANIPDLDEQAHNEPPGSTVVAFKSLNVQYDIVWEKKLQTKFCHLLFATNRASCMMKAKYFLIRVTFL